jgi:hypothetical protein
MINLQLTREPIAKAGMLIRKPAAEVYEDPNITTKFWFTCFRCKTAQNQSRTAFTL